MGHLQITPACVQFLVRLAVFVARTERMNKRKSYDQQVRAHCTARIAKLCESFPLLIPRGSGIQLAHGLIIVRDIRAGSTSQAIVIGIDGEAVFHQKSVSWLATRVRRWSRGA